MEDHLWTICNGSDQITTLQETAWRLIEAQHILATRKLVDSQFEQEILEELIDQVKPALFGKEFEGLHPLLYTPFRYPPLQYGSRFGTRSERSIWYGSLKLTTAMAEKAFYQFNFLRAAQAEFGIVAISLTAFSTPIKTMKGINLVEPPFLHYKSSISSPNDYKISQTLGHSMRLAKVEAFHYMSARDPEHHTNIGVFTPRAFLQKKPIPSSFHTWQCIINHHVVEFIRLSEIKKETISYSLNQFLVDNELPFPAN